MKPTVTILLEEYQNLIENQKDFNKIRVYYQGQDGKFVSALIPESKASSEIKRYTKELRQKIASQDNFIEIQRHNELVLRQQISDLKNKLEEKRKSWWWL